MGRRRKVKSKKGKPVRYSTDTPDDNESSINSLPPEVLIKVFGYLPPMDRIRLERVCKQWRLASQKSWKTVQQLDVITWFHCSKTKTNLAALNSNNSRIALCTENRATLEKVVSLCGYFVKTFGFLEANDLNALSVISRFCPNITRFRATSTSGKSVKGLSQYFQRNSNLTSVQVDLCTPETIAALKWLAAEKLEEFYVGKISRKCHISKIVSFIRGLPSLKHLEIPMDPTLLKTIETRTTLTSLILAGSNFDYDDCDELSSVLKLENLQRLTLSKLKIPDDFFVKLANCCKRLQYLNIAENKCITRSGLSELRSLPELTDLDVSGVDSLTDKVLMKMDRLKTVRCVNCKRVTEEGYVELIERSKQLELLAVSYDSEKTKEWLEAVVENLEERGEDKQLYLTIALNLDNEYRKNDDSDDEDDDRIEKAVEAVALEINGKSKFLTIQVE